MNTQPSTTEELLRERVRILELGLEVALGKWRREYIRNDMQMGLTAEESNANFEGDESVINLRAALSQQKEDSVNA